MNISTYIPNDASDIAIIKGKEEDKSGDYTHYIRGFKNEVKGRSFED